ncbi:extensin [bacterium]|nr:extensin [bacterium]
MTQAIRIVTVLAIAAAVAVSSCATPRSIETVSAAVFRPVVPAPLKVSLTMPTFTFDAPTPDYLTRPAPRIDLHDRATLADDNLLALLSGDITQCRMALDAAGVEYEEVPPKQTRGGCGYEGAIRVSRSDVAYSKELLMTCALAARMQLWEELVVQPAAERYLGSRIVKVKALGAFSCRNVAGSRKLSKHAFGQATDIAGFQSADGRDIMVLADFRDASPEGRFLREVFRSSCEVFDTSLGPDYNADHANHFHFDIGGGGRFCR